MRATDKRKRINPKWLCLSAVLAVCLIFLPLCLRGAELNDSHEKIPDVSSEQVYPVGSYERRAAEYAAAGKDISGREVTEFGEGSIFGGITVEADENGEPVCEESDGTLWVMVTDVRFCSFSEFSGFVRRNAGVKEAERLCRYFCDRDGALFCAFGGNGRQVERWRRYFVTGSRQMTVRMFYKEKRGKTYVLSRSDVCLVMIDGVWKLDSVTEEK